MQRELVGTYLFQILTALHDGPVELTPEEVDELVAFFGDLVALRNYLRQAGRRELAARLSRN